MLTSQVSFQTNWAFLFLALMCPSQREITVVGGATPETEETGGREQACGKDTIQKWVESLEKSSICLVERMKKIN